METKLARIVANNPDLTYRLLSKITGISKSTLHELASGTKPMTTKYAILISNALDLEEEDVQD